ncbi:MAG: aspartate/glutamate racemase family protein [Microcoleus anatoxicus]|uniref:aspartate/glutamate racemase family protein n=1 Tax=Microcoleus anatoxicus TaxID=2705319 RepID=UPI00366F0E97
MNPTASCVSLKPEREYSFATAQEAIAAMGGFQQRLKTIAQAQKQRGELVNDQIFPTEVIAIRPGRTQAPPLILIGGMGPLAGLGGFEQACKRFPTREIVLFQACSLQNRTSVIQHETCQSANYSEQQFVTMFAAAVVKAMEYVSSSEKTIHIMVLCNTAHYFLPEVIERLQYYHPQVFQQLQWFSLVDSVVEYLQWQNLQHPLILCTNGTKQGRVYSSPLQKSGIAYTELNDTLQSILMDSIYQGVKAFDSDFACQAGEKLFRECLKTESEIDCIVAGCSEIPYLLDWLKISASHSVQHFISAVENIDPVELALTNTSKSLSFAYSR